MMERGGVGGYIHASYNLGSFNSLLNHSPPLNSAVDKFLFANGKKDSTHFNLRQEKPKPTTTTAATTTMPAAADGGEMCAMQDDHFVDGLLLDDGEGSSLNHEINEKELMNDDEKSLVSNSKKYKGRKGKKGSRFFIKGQWTLEEDRMLIKLVRQYGLRQWARLAENFVGREGKQCRERWHNHLRPDIKKDAWSEEEEMMLVVAHEQFGNKWATIARQIPGRTENSIKNHWNATKRRQICRRKNKKNEPCDTNAQFSILEEYIKSKILCNSTENPNPNPNPTQISMNPNLEMTNTSPSSSPVSTNISGDPPNENLLESSDEFLESSPLTIVDPCHDELVFMQNLFNNTTNHNLSQFPDNHHDHQISSSDGLHYDDHQQQEQLMGSNDHSWMMTTNDNTNYPFYSDWFLSSLLGGTNNQGGSNGLMMDYHAHDDQVKDLDMMVMDVVDNYSSEGKDVDLIEMISSCKFSQFSSSSSN